MSVQSHKLAAANAPNSSTSTGAGFAHIQQELENSPSLSQDAKTLLSNLLVQHNVQLSDTTIASQLLPPPKKRLKKMIVVDKNATDETTLQMAAADQLSFLGSLLAVAQEQSGAAVTTRTFITACSLAVPPTAVPAVMGAKEIVLAALHFLSSTPPVNSTATATANSTGSASPCQVLPLLQATQLLPDLEKRSYRKAHDWNLPDIEAFVLELDDLFLHSCHDYAWLGREHLLPGGAATASQQDLNLLVLKGFATAALQGKAPTVQRKKKVQSPTLTGEFGGIGDMPVAAFAITNEAMPAAAMSSVASNNTNESMTGSIGLAAPAVAVTTKIIGMQVDPTDPGVPRSSPEM